MKLAISNWSTSLLGSEKPGFGNIAAPPRGHTPLELAKMSQSSSKKFVTDDLVTPLGPVVWSWPSVIEVLVYWDQKNRVKNFQQHRCPAQGPHPSRIGKNESKFLKKIVTDDLVTPVFD